MIRTTKLNARESLTARFIRQKIGTQPAYFSLTGEILDASVRRDGGIVACGCLHDDILKEWPDLADAEALHLSKVETGEPMHAQANGWYWYAGAVVEAGHPKPEGAGRYIGEATQGRSCTAIFAGHARITMDEAQQLVERRLSPQQFAEWIDAQRPRWKAEADAAVAKYFGGA